MIVLFSFLFYHFLLDSLHGFVLFSTLGWGTRQDRVQCRQGKTDWLVNDVYDSHV